MTSIVTEILKRRPLLFYPLIDGNVKNYGSAGSDYDGIAANLGSAAGPFGENVASFNGTSSEIEVPNVSDLLDGAGSVEIFAQLYHVSPSGAHRGIYNVMFNNNTAGIRLHRHITDGNIYLTIRRANGAGQAQISRGPANDAWYTMRAFYGFNCDHARLDISPSSVASTATSFSTDYVADSGNSLFIGQFGDDTEFNNGRIAYFALFKNTCFSENEYDAIDAADSGGTLCTPDADELVKLQSDNSLVASRSDLIYRLHDTVGNLLYSGSDLTTDADGIITNEWYLPATGAYDLTVRDGTNSRATSTRIDMVAA